MPLETKDGDSAQTVFVLDTGAFISGLGQQLPGVIVTSPLVIQEVRSPGTNDNIARLKAANRLRVIAPSSKSVAVVKGIMNQTKDEFVVTLTDTEILALALELHAENKKIRLITDDYAIQNVAKLLKVPFTGYGQRGIHATWKWEIYCPACFQKYSHGQVGDRCENCGNALKRRRIK